MNTKNERQGIEDRPATGIAGLDDVLNGGLARNRTFLLEGSPGTGKTTIALQFLLTGATAGERNLYVTMSETEEELRMNAASHGWNLDGVEIFELAPPETLLSEDQQQSLLYSSDLELGESTKRIFGAFDRAKPHRVVVDSLSEIRLLAQSSLRYRRQILAMKHFFAQRGATVLLLDDLTTEVADKSVHSVAHGVIRLEELAPEYGSDRRRLRVLKYRGSRFRGGYHDFVIETGGVRVFPRLVSAEHRRAFKRDLFKTNSEDMNRLLGGGIERGSSVLILGPAGAGKSIMALNFVVSAIERGERVAMFVFDEEMGLLFPGPLAWAWIWRRCASADALPHADRCRGAHPWRILVPRPREHRRLRREDDCHRQPDGLPGLHAGGTLRSSCTCTSCCSICNRSGATTFLTVAQHGLMGEMRAPIDLTYLADAVILLRYFEAVGEVRRAISIVKKRTSAHETTIREYRMHSKGISLGQQLTNFHGVLRGVPEIVGGLPGAQRRKR